jgi:hypothetical protein
VELLQARFRPGQPAESSSRPIRATVVAALAGAAVLALLASLVLVAPFTGARVFYEVGKAVGVADPVAGAAYLFGSLPPVAGRALLVLITGAGLAYLAWEVPSRGRIACAALCALAIADLLVVDADLNPVLPAQKLGPPAWTASLKAHPETRFYFGGKFRGILALDDLDLPRFQWRPPQGVSVEAGRNLLMANLALTPAAWSVRELVSYDLPHLWPVEQARAAALFEHADQAARLRYLARGGVRYCLLGAPPSPSTKPIGPVGEDFGPMAVYDCVPDAHRAYVVDTAVVVPDVTTQLERLFEASFDAASTVMLEQAAAPGAESGATEPASARITLDGDREIRVDAAAGEHGGFLVLLDSFDRSWHADVDGRPAPLLRANALYRAVRLAPGRHTVTFTYRPTPLYATLPMAALAAIGLCVLALKKSSA